MILGVTGGIASGKSTVSAYLKSKGIPIVDADAISKKVVGKNTKGAKMLEKEFGSMFFTDGRLERTRLARYCFATKERTEKLNAIMHPLILDEMDKQTEFYRSQGAKIIILDAPLLIESGLTKKCDKVVVVTCSQRTRVQRAIKRSNISKLEVMRRMERQLPDEERKRYADFVIDNSGTLEKTLAQADKIIEELTNG